VSIQVKSRNPRQVIDITTQIESELPPESGLVNVTVLHTTAAVTTADLDSGTDIDLLDFLEAITPKRQWIHPHNPAHAPAHLVSSIIGPSVTLPVLRGQIVLGTWQRVILVELDGPRAREVGVAFIPTGK
jgi:secondary thiamine-phosphate synthase enzyme